MTITFHKQETCWTCGAAAFRMALSAFGIKRSEKQLVKLLHTNKVRGTWTRNFPPVAERFGLTYVVGRKGTFAQLGRLMKDGYQIVICYVPDVVDHYAVVRKIGKSTLCIFDPWFGPDHKYSTKKFNKIWKTDKRWESETRWFIAIRR